MQQIWQEFHVVAKTEIRLLDKWQEYKPRILQLAATKTSTEPLLTYIDDMDEGCACSLLLQYCLHLKCTFSAMFC